MFSVFVAVEHEMYILGLHLSPFEGLNLDNNRRSGVTKIFGPPTNIRYSLVTVLIHNSGHFGPHLPFWAPGPPALPGLPMASYATEQTVQL